ncbi:glycosyltransferase [Candidatus Pelagibacter bacterium]|jgi:N-acetylglucosaminyl-diphospho-decaprenol L-rhamnosyltransferase|nr:glycosyltransferase [Candidatus Pelagibacter bacterium]
MHKELTIIIVTFNSDNHVLNLIQKFPKNVKILLIENSGRKKFKKTIEKNRKNVQCILTGDNIGYGRANNIGIKYAKTEFVMILNPDALVSSQVIKKLHKIIKEDKKIAAISCQSKDDKNKISKHFYFNKSSKVKEKYNNSNSLIDVDYFIGSMFLARKKILLKANLFDEKYFLNFEEIDLFRKISNLGYRICIEKKLYFKHLKGSSAKSSMKFEMDKSSKWHYSWSQIYFYKKYYGMIFTLAFFIKELTINLTKIIYFLLFGKKKNIILIYYGLLGLINSIIGKKSYYRPKI